MSTHNAVTSQVPSSRCGMVCFGLGAAFALALLVCHQALVPPAYAQDTKGSGQLQALGSGIKDKRSNGCLWVYNPDKRQLACYAADGGQHIKLVGARRVAFDLELEIYNDKSEFTPKEANETLKKGQK